MLLLLPLQGEKKVSLIAIPDFLFSLTLFLPSFPPFYPSCFPSPFHPPFCLPPPPLLLLKVYRLHQWELSTPSDSTSSLKPANYGSSCPGPAGIGEPGNEATPGSPYITYSLTHSLTHLACWLLIGSSGSACPFSVSGLELLSPCFKPDTI